LERKEKKRPRLGFSEVVEAVLREEVREGCWGAEKAAE